MSQLLNKEFKIEFYFSYFFRGLRLFCNFYFIIAVKFNILFGRERRKLKKRLDLGYRALRAWE